LVAGVPEGFFNDLLHEILQSVFSILCLYVRAAICFASEDITGQHALACSKLSTPAMLGVGKSADAELFTLTDIAKLARVG